MPGTRPFLLALLVASAALVAVAALSAAGSFHESVASLQVTAGWAVWRASGCEGCHGLYGHGGNDGPDLTHVIATGGEIQIRERLNAPHPSIIGQGRASARYGFTAGEVEQLIAFLRWIGEQAPARQWPPTPSVPVMVVAPL